MKLLYGLILFGTLVGIGFALVAYFQWRLRRKYSRQRFAFSALSSFMTYATVVSASVITETPPWLVPLITYRYLRDHTFEPASPISTNAAVVLVLLGFVAYKLIIQIHRNWDGVVSDKVKNGRKLNQDLGISTEAFAELTRLVRVSKLREEIEEEKQPSDSDDESTPLRPQQKAPSYSWADLSIELLLDKRNHLKRGEWRSEHQFWLCWDRDSESWVAVKCVMVAPTKNEVDAFVKYAGSISNKTVREFVVLVKDSHLIDSDRKSANVEYISEEALVEGLVDLSEYFEKINSRISLKLPNSALTLMDTWVESRFVLNKEIVSEQAGEPPNDESSEVISSVESWLKSDRRTQIAILGEYGQGKSSVALMLTKKLIDGRAEDSGRVPILIELRGQNFERFSARKILSLWAGQYRNVSVNGLEALNKLGRLLFIFDGFDEMVFSGQLGDKERQIDALWSFDHHNAKFVITGRPNLFVSKFERQRALHVETGAGGLFRCEEWNLKKFVVSDIERALRSIDPAKRDAMLAAIRSNERFYEIASRPSLLHVCTVIWDGEFQAKADRITASEVMTRFLDATLERQTERARQLEATGELWTGDEGGVPGNYMVLNGPERRFFMLGVAVHMFSKDETNQISNKELDSVIEKLSLLCPKSVSEAREPDNEGRIPSIDRRIEHAGERFLSLLKTDVRACGLLVVDNVDGMFRFGHKSFAELLVAEFAYNHFAGSKNDVYVSIDSLREGAVNDILRTSVVREYFCEMLLNSQEEVGERAVVDVVEGGRLPMAYSLRLFDVVVKPSVICRMRWFLGLRCLELSCKKRRATLNAESRGEQIGVGPRGFEALSDMLLFEFVNLESDSWRKGLRSSLYVGLGTISIFGFIAMFLAGVFEAFEEYLISFNPFPVWAGLAMVFFLAASFYYVVGVEWINRGYGWRARLWVEISLKEGCELPEVLDVLLAKSGPINKIRGGKVGKVFGVLIGKFRVSRSSIIGTWRLG